MKSTLYIPTEAHKAYEATPEFQAYLADKTVWETAHAEYSTRTNPMTYNRMVIAEHRMKIALRICRALPEHKTAFGW